MSILADLGLNLLAESIGICVTVYVIDRWAKKREARRLRPVLLAALKDARRIYADGMDLLERALLSTATQADLSTLSDPKTHIQRPEVVEIINRLSLSQEANILVQVQPMAYWVWRDYLVQWATDYTSAVAKFLERYPGVVDPELYASAHRLQSAPIVVVPVRSRSVLTATDKLPLIAGLAEPLTQLRESVRNLERQLGEAHEDAYFSHLIFDRVLQTVRSYPTRSGLAPYRPA